MKKLYRILPCAALALLCAACDTPPADDIETAAGNGESAAEWRQLFNGRDFEGWRGYHRDDVPDGWAIDDDALHFTSADGDINKGLITEEQFSDFELEFEWRIAPIGNSGIFFRVIEGPEAIWHTGPEYQVVDNAHPDGELPETSAASNYALYGPDRDITRPVGEYNQGRLVVDGPRVEHWLNGEMVVAYELESEEWESLVAESPFADLPEYGRTETGHIALQEGGPVWYRNIRIREVN